ncbi:MAG: hypothetical protein JOZ42_05180 [Acetobacteraceae bacterium]|nr:hypothetical protein [Acetobacteraceae bacterium]
MFISRKPLPAAVRERGRRFVELAERAHQAGQQAHAEYFIDLAYEVMSVRYTDAQLEEMAAEL